MANQQLHQTLKSDESPESRVIALRFRPKTFDQVIGQEAITRTLSNAVLNNSVHHAYLFAGARGTGKTTTARILAKAVNCAKAPTTDPCGVCPSCVDIASSSSTYVREIDAASNTGIDNVREVIITSAAFSPPPGQYKIFIIDEAHQLSPQSFNALLKTIEEPPPRVIFIMATTEIQKVPETIMSRCQVFEFRTIPLNKVAGELRRISNELGIEITDSALLTVARAAEGSMRDAESALDQIISFAGSKVSNEDVSAALGLVNIETLNDTLAAIAAQDSRATLRIVDEVVTRGYDLRNFCRELMTHIRALLVTKIAGFEQELVQMPPGEGEALVRLSENFSEQDLVRFFTILTKTEQDIRLSSQPRFQLEIGLVKLAHSQRLYLIEEALGRLDQLRASGGGTSMSSGRTSMAGPGVENRTASPRFSPASSPAMPGRHNVASDATVPARSETPESVRTFGTSRPITSGADALSLGAARKPPASGGSAVASEQEFSSAKTAEPTKRIMPPAVRSQAPEPPPGIDEPYEVELEPPTPHLPDSAASQAGAGAAAASKPGAGPAGSGPGFSSTGIGSVEKIKDVLESKKKMRFLAALGRAETVIIDGPFLRVSYLPSDTIFKTQLEAKDARAAIEEASFEALGDRLTLSVTLGGSGAPDTASAGTSRSADTPSAGTSRGPDTPSAGASRVATRETRSEKIAVEPRPESHPAVRAVVDKFQGEVIEVTKKKR